MKAQTRALVASVVVIALALSAVSGITYSWFTDTEQSKIDISTAVVDYEVTWATSGSGSEGTQWTVDNGKVSVSEMDANDTIPIVKGIQNKSTIKTVYRIVATAILADGHNYTLYDLKNIYVGGVQLNANGDADGNITLGETVIADWTELSVGSNPNQQNICITTPESYGGGPGEEIVAYNPTTGQGSTSKDETYTKDWSQSTGKEGLSISLSIVAVQGDYPYSKMTTSEKVGEGKSDKAVAAMIPENKVLKADSIESSSGEQTVSNVIVDFSNVSTIDDGDTEISAENKVQVEVTSVNTATSTVSLDLTLWTVSQGTATQVQSPEFDEPVVITMTVPGAIYDPKVIYNGSNTDGTVLSSTINGSGSGATTTIVFSVKHFSNYEIVGTMVITDESGLVTAMEKGGSYKLGADIEGISQTVSVKALTLLDMNGHKISTNNVATLIEVKDNLKVLNGTLTNTYASSARILAIENLTSDVTLSLENVDIVGPTTGTDDRGISVYGNTAGVEIDISGGSVKTYHYPLCVAEGNSGVLIYVENATIEGYSVAQSNSPNAEMVFNGCTLNGVNNSERGSNDYSVFVFYKKANGSKVTCNDCNVNAIKRSTADQELVTFYTNSFVEFNQSEVKVNGVSVPEEGVTDEDEIYKEIGSHVLAYPYATFPLASMAGYEEGWLQVVAWSAATSVSTLKEAMKAGGYVLLYSSQEADVVVPEGVSAILNIWGETLTADSSHAIENKGILHIVDSDAGGSVECAVSGKNIVQNDKGAVLYIENGIFSNTAGNCIVDNMGECIILGGEFTCSGSLDDAFKNGEGAHLTIKAGTFNVDPSKYVPDGCEVTKNDDDNTWTVSSSDS